MRELAVSPRRIQVVDRVEGGRGQSMCARLLLHPDVRFERRGKRLFLIGARSTVELECEHVVTAEDAWWCPDFGVKLATRQFAIWYGAAPGSGGFTLQSAPALVAERKKIAAASALPAARSFAATFDG